MRPNRRLINQLDLLCKQIVHVRDGNKCVKCGKSGILHAAHVYPKGKYQRLRFMTTNILTLCLGCHLYWAHKDPIGFSEWFRSTFPERYDHLVIMARNAPKLDLKEVKLSLELEAKELGV